MCLGGTDGSQYIRSLEGGCVAPNAGSRPPGCRGRNCDASAVRLIRRRKTVLPAEAAPAAHWQAGTVADGVNLRPFTDEDLSVLNREWIEPDLPGEFEWFGFRPKRGLDLERRLKEDGLIGDAESWLVVASGEGAFLGTLGWRPVGTGNWEIGCFLLSDYRGQGIGTEAQRLLVKYLFDTTPANRIQAGTEIDNIAEQRALEKAGFHREGVQRGLYFRPGAWRDSVMYGLTRSDRN